MKRMFLTLLLTVVWALAPAGFAQKIPGRYIVELSTDSVSEHMFRSVGRAGIRRGAMRSAEATSQRTRVRSEQQQMRRRLQQRQATVLDSVDTVANAIIVDIPDSAAAQLASIPGVKRVLPARKMRMLLDRAVALHKITDAWNQIGADRAGLGMKIAIIDSGIDSNHPGFQDPSLVAPDSFPRVNSASDLPYTNGKVIVARSYVGLLARRDPDLSARDRVGHGTALGMVAAGVTNTGPLATITGVAPKAYLGNYKVFGTPGSNDSSSDAAILKAIDDAVSDGMDVINLSLGSPFAPRLSDDIEVDAVDRATKAGVIVVVAAGNSGPDLSTVSSPATALSAIAVAATSNDRTFAASAEAAGFAPFIAIAGNGPAPSGPVAGPFIDVAQLDGDGLACSEFRSGSLSGRIALIQRGSCTFETKLVNVARGGAIGGLVYAAESSPSPFPMGVGAATLPAEMISFQDGTTIKEALASQSSLDGTLRFTLSAVPIPPNRLTDFSAAGPNVDFSIKPDLAAVGGDIYVATQTLDANGEMYDPSGYILVDGTSFSSPLVAGVAALIKGARPGLTVDQYRSLIINTAAAAQNHIGETPAVQQAGAGLLDAQAALRSTVSANPVSVSFGTGGADAQIARTVTLTNLGTNTETFVISAAPRRDGPAPSLDITSVEITAGTSKDVPVSWNVIGLAPGTYEGFLTVTGTSSGTEAHLPYWYAVTSTEPARVTVLDAITDGRRGTAENDAILFRVTEISGVPLTNVQLDVSVISGGGTVRGITNYDSEIPGLFGINVRLGAFAGNNVFRIQAGAISLDVTIVGN